MSTRSMTVIRSQGCSVNLYRHFDGYPAEAGASLLAAIGSDQAYKAPAGVVDALLQYGRPGPDARPWEHPDYEVAFYGAEDQGDLEHVYLAEFRDANRDQGKPARWEVRHYARPDGGWDSKHDSFRAWTCTCTDLEWLRQTVNRDRAAINGRMADYRRKHPDRAEAMGGDYDMIPPTLVQVPA